MFGSFFFVLMGIYFCYYTGMIGYDLYAAGKENSSESVAHEVDISGTASSYVAKDVKSMFQNNPDSSLNKNDTESGDNVGGIAQYIGNEYQGGMRVDNLHDMFMQESQTESIFSSVSLAM